jgi:hypothetical protein
MLVKDENKFCYIVNDKISEPKDSLKEAIQDYLEEAKENGYSLDSIELSNPYFFVPELSGRRIVDNLIYTFPDIMFDNTDKHVSRCYIPPMDAKHIEELDKELSKAYCDWEKRHGYENKSFQIFIEDIKIYPIK